MFTPAVIPTFGAGRTLGLNHTVGQLTHLFQFGDVQAHTNISIWVGPGGFIRTRRQPRFDFFPSRWMSCDLVTWNSSSIRSGRVRSTKAFW